MMGQRYTMLASLATPGTVLIADSGFWSSGVQTLVEKEPLPLLNLPTDLPRRYRYQLRVHLFANLWRYDYELIGACGGLNLHISGPHVYDNSEHWSAGLELHSRTPLVENTPPSHDECWLLKCPCWHDGTSSYAQEHFLPMVLSGDHERVLREMIYYADEQWPTKGDLS